MEVLCNKKKNCSVRSGAVIRLSLISGKKNLPVAGIKPGPIRNPES